MSDQDNTGNNNEDVVRLDRVRDKLQRRRQDAQAEALAAQFHKAMGWKGKPDAPGGKRKRGKKKPS